MGGFLGIKVSIFSQEASPSNNYGLGLSIGVVKTKRNWVPIYDSKTLPKSAQNCNIRLAKHNQIDLFKAMQMTTNLTKDNNSNT
jgi:hypothetical protein